MAEKDVLILGIGNILMQDDGIGIHVLNELKKMNLPDQVELMDGGTGGFHLIPIIEGKKKLIILDAILSEDKPGSVYRLKFEDIDYKNTPNISLHEAGIIEALKLSSVHEKMPETVIIGVRPKEYKTFGLDVTPEIRKIFPKVIELVLKEVSHCS